MGQKCMKVFAAWGIVVGAAGAAEWDEAQLVRLASGDDDEIKRAVEGLGARYDQAHYALMQGLFKGEVYRWGERQAQHGLVIVGDESLLHFFTRQTSGHTLASPRRCHVLKVCAGRA